jgi:hypothetical protein
MMAAMMRLRTTALGRTKLPTRMPNGFRQETTAAQKGTAHSSKSLFSSSSGTPSSSASFPVRLWESYTKALLKYPLPVKSGAAALIFFTSDSATQKIMDPEASWDASRALSGAGFGVVGTAWLHYWWGFLEVVLNRRLPVGAYGQNKLVNALGKVAADQLVGAPLYLYSYYCITHFGTEWVARTTAKTTAPPSGGEPKEAAEAAPSKDTIDAIDDVVPLLKETSDRALEMLPDTLLRHWTVWPIVHTLNFYYNPIHHRVLVQNIVLIFWSGYLSHLNNGGLDVSVATAPEAADDPN